MQKAIIGKKIGMTQVFTDAGKMIPVTVIEAGPCTVIQVKTVGNEGYDSVQVGFIEVSESKLNSPQRGHFDKAEQPYRKVLKEFRLDDAANMKVGDVIKADVFSQGEKVDVTGISKGKGFAGPIKRWGAHRGPMSHGSHYHRGPGSMGACSTPSKVMKGKRLAGHMGCERVTVQNLDVVKIDAEHNLLLVKGAVPGARGSIVTVKNTVKN